VTPVRIRPARTRPPRVRARDLVSEAIAGLIARPARVGLTVLGTIIGVGALVATLGLSKTASNQIVGHFDAAAATEVQFSVTTKGSIAPDFALPEDAADRIQRLNGVVAAGTLSEVKTNGALISSLPLELQDVTDRHSVLIKAASSGLFRAVGATLAGGRFFDAGHSSRGDHVVVLGETMAARLGIDRVDQQPSVFIGGQLYTVIGLLAHVSRQPALLRAAIIPDGTARRDFALASTMVQVKTRIGAARLIGEQGPQALSPGNPGLISVSQPNDPRDLRGQVKNDLNALFLLLGGVSLLVGAIGIANVTLVSVLERVGEIGLRRALGAGRRHIAAQFLMESTAMGAAGGLIGASLGVLVIVGVAASKTWTPVLDPWVPLGAPVLGAAIGLLSGTYPSLRAASLEPVEALRAGT
jgi:ABC-type antimicrobial peptide transport system permease subunit